MLRILHYLNKQHKRRGQGQALSSKIQICRCLWAVIGLSHVISRRTTSVRHRAVPRDTQLPFCFSTLRTTLWGPPELPSQPLAIPASCTLRTQWKRLACSVCLTRT